MKTIFLKRALLMLLATTILSVLYISCDKNNDDMNDQMYTTSGTASGSQQNPPVTTTGSGTLTGTFNAQTNNWQYAVNWSTLSSAATIVEVHGPAGTGVNANLLFTLAITVPGVSGSATGNTTLTNQQKEFLLSGELYYTVLTATNITGEIRGQIAATAQ